MPVLPVPIFWDDVEAAIHYVVHEQGEAMAVLEDRAAIARLEAEFEAEIGAASVSERSSAKHLARAMPLPAPSRSRLTMPNR